uniref:Uncharacterized protein n=1 Tax=Meloidogyne enterolobii TaxID=390850 RepID=A0A6V7TYA8_MELEN|nr:unnamed protein product [Meloidogyne enterolobii]
MSTISNSVEFIRLRRIPEAQQQQTFPSSIPKIASTNNSTKETSNKWSPQQKRISLLKRSPRPATIYSTDIGETTKIQVVASIKNQKVEATEKSSVVLKLTNVVASASNNRCYKPASASNVFNVKQTGSSKTCSNIPQHLKQLSKNSSNITETSLKQKQLLQKPDRTQLNLLNQKQLQNLISKNNNMSDSNIQKHILKQTLLQEKISKTDSSFGSSKIPSNCPNIPQHSFEKKQNNNKKSEAATTTTKLLLLPTSVSTNISEANKKDGEIQENLNKISNLPSSPPLHPPPSIPLRRRPLSLLLLRQSHRQQQQRVQIPPPILPSVKSSLPSLPSSSSLQQQNLPSFPYQAQKIQVASTLSKTVDNEAHPLNEAKSENPPSSNLKEEEDPLLFEERVKAVKLRRPAANKQISSTSSSNNASEFCSTVASVSTSMAASTSDNNIKNVSATDFHASNNASVSSASNLCPSTRRNSTTIKSQLTTIFPSTKTLTNSNMKQMENVSVNTKIRSNSQEPSNNLCIANKKNNRIEALKDEAPQQKNRPHSLLLNFISANMSVLRNKTKWSSSTCAASTTSTTSLTTSTASASTSVVASPSATSASTCSNQVASVSASSYNQTASASTFLNPAASDSLIVSASNNQVADSASTCSTNASTCKNASTCLTSAASASTLISSTTTTSSTSFWNLLPFFGKQQQNTTSKAAKLKRREDRRRRGFSFPNFHLQNEAIKLPETLKIVASEIDNNKNCSSNKKKLNSRNSCCEELNLSLLQQNDKINGNVKEEDNLIMRDSLRTPNGAQNGKAQLTATSSVCSSHNNLQRLSSRENGGALVKQILSKPGPYPQIVVVTKGEECGFWLDGAIELEDVENSDSFIYTNVANVESKLETDDEGALSYRRHFLGREHHNFYALDPLLGPLILSVRVETTSTQTPSSPKSTPNQQQQQNYRLILRSRLGTKHQLIPSTSFNNSRPSASQLARHLYADIGTDRFWPVAFPGGSELILQFDEHVISNTYKFVSFLS